MTLNEKLKKAFDLLCTIPVTGSHVDTMHHVRVLLADVHNQMVNEGRAAKVKEADENG